MKFHIGALKCLQQADPLITKYVWLDYPFKTLFNVKRKECNILDIAFEINVKVEQKNKRLKDTYSLNTKTEDSNNIF